MCITATDTPEVKTYCTLTLLLRLEETKLIIPHHWSVAFPYASAVGDLIDSWATLVRAEFVRLNAKYLTSTVADNAAIEFKSLKDFFDVQARNQANQFSSMKKENTLIRQMMCELKADMAALTHKLDGTPNAPAPVDPPAAAAVVPAAAAVPPVPMQPSLGSYFNRPASRTRLNSSYVLGSQKGVMANDFYVRWFQEDIGNLKPMRGQDVGQMQKLKAFMSQIDVHGGYAAVPIPPRPDMTVDPHSYEKWNNDLVTRANTSILSVESKLLVIKTAATAAAAAADGEVGHVPPAKKRKRDPLSTVTSLMKRMLSLAVVIE
jgi:hypothetical protein